MVFHSNGLFGAFSFISFLFCVILLPCQLEAWNAGTCLYLTWTGIANLTLFINSIIWRGNAVNWVPVWCDISARILVGVSFAIPASSLCINRRLYKISPVPTSLSTKAEKHRMVMVDLSVGIGIPVLGMILQYIPQGHRFNIYEDVGCFPHTFNTWVAIVVMNVPIILIGLMSGFYAINSIIFLNKNRIRLNGLVSKHANLNSTRYIRLMLLAGIEILLTVPITGYIIYINTMQGMYPWLSWDNTHWRFSRVDQVPALIWRSQPLTARGLESTRWFCVMCAFIFFAFFGFAEEARKYYRSVIPFISECIAVAVALLSNTIPLSKSDPPPGREAVATLKEPSRRDTFDTLGTIPTFLVDVCPSPQRKKCIVITSDVGCTSPDDCGKPTIASTSSCISSPLGSGDDATKDSSRLTTVEQPAPAASCSLEGRRQSHMNHRLFHHFRSFLNLDSSSVSSICSPPLVPTLENSCFDPEGQVFQQGKPATTVTVTPESQLDDHRSRSQQLSQHFRSFLSLD